MLPTTYIVQDATTDNIVRIGCDYILFDAALLVILPTLAGISYSQSDMIAFSIFCLLIFVHIIIAFCRYCLKKEIKWNKCEIVAILMGLGLCGLGLCGLGLCGLAFTRTDLWYTFLLVAVGFFMIAGHVGGLCCPDRPLYYCLRHTKNAKYTYMNRI